MQGCARHHRLIVLLLLSMTLLAGCNTVAVQEELTQEQATEIVAALSTQGISAVAQRETGGRGRYRVEVKRGAYSDAIQIMHERGLPSEPRATFSELIAPRGLVPDSREIEALRLDRALAAELEESLENNPAVASARVVVRVNSVPLEFSGEAERSGISVSLRLRPGAEVSENEARELALRAIPGIDPARIYITLHKEAPEVSASTVDGVVRSGQGRVAHIPLTDFLWGWKVPEDDYNSLALGLTIGILLVFFLGTVIGNFFSNYRRGRGVAEQSGSPASGARRLPPGRPEARPRRELLDTPPGPGSGQRNTEQGQ